MRDDVTARCRSVHRSGITPLGMRFFTPPHASRYGIGIAATSFAWKLAST